MASPRMPAPGTRNAPNYWMYEASGELQPAVENYLNNRPLTVRQVALMRAYLRQWIVSPAWDMNPAADADARAELRQLRAEVDRIVNVRDIGTWLRKAIDAGMDPL